MFKHSTSGAAVLALLAAMAPTGAWAQAHQPGTGQSGPASASASNIDRADTSDPIAPHLPSPDVNGGPEVFLRAAEQALAGRRTGEAQQALEMAETRLLDRSTPIGGVAPSENPRVRAVNAALQALGHGDIGAAQAATRAAMMPPRGAMAPPPGAYAPSSMPPGAYVPPPPPGPYVPVAPRY